MKKIAWEDVPGWARQHIIKRGGGTGMVQINRNNDSLTISGGVSRYNGREVAQYGVEVSEQDTREETISLFDLPSWAKSRLGGIGIGSQTQMHYNGDTLQVTAEGSAFYNGKRVNYFGTHSLDVSVNESKERLQEVTVTFSGEILTRIYEEMGLTRNEPEPNEQQIARYITEMVWLGMNE